MRAIFLGLILAAVFGVTPVNGVEFLKERYNFEVEAEKTLEINLRSLLKRPVTEEIAWSQNWPRFAEFNAETETLKLSPSGEDTGTHSFRLYAVQGENADFASLTIEVALGAGNRRPHWGGWFPVFRVCEGQALGAAIDLLRAEDPDGDELEFFVEEKAGWVLPIFAGSELHFTGVAKFKSGGFLSVERHIVIVRASDGELHGDLRVRIDVRKCS